MKSGNRNAAHLVNAILNYAYAVLESEVRIKAIAEGYHPTIGIMHEGSDGSSKFIFDLMEPVPPKADRAVLDFVKGHVFDPADYGADGGGKGLVNDQTGWGRPKAATRNRAMDVAVGASGRSNVQCRRVKITTAPEIAGALNGGGIATARVGQMGTLEGGEGASSR